MRILVTGANGQVGRNVVALGDEYPFEVFGFSRDQLDITCLSSIRNVFSMVQPNVVINAAAYTAVDNAESDVELAFAINERGPQHLVEACVEMEIPLFHISTDYVFEGTLNRPYTENDIVAPLGVYARSKEAGEQRVRETWDQHIILRTSWVFSKEGACFPKSILNAAKNRLELKVVDDQVGGPTCARAIAKALLDIAWLLKQRKTIEWGTYHFSQIPFVTWYQFALKTINAGKSLGLVSEAVSVLPCTSDEYPSRVLRPANSRLDCTKIANKLGIIQTSWEDDVEYVVRFIAGSASGARS